MRNSCRAVDRRASSLVLWAGAQQSSGGKAQRVMEGIGFIALAIAAVLVGFFVVRQSKTKGRWGIGSLNPACPRCGTSMPAIRRPASIAEAMWGGWTCPKCGCKVDKYGHERAAR